METKPSAFETALEKVKKRMRRTNAAVQDTEDMLRSGMVENAYEAAFQLAYEAEQLTLLTRTLPAYTGNPTAAQASEDTMLRAVPIQIGFTCEGWFGVFIPALLPKKSKGSADYIRTMLYPAMRRFFQGKEPVRYDRCVLIFRHVYDKQRPERRYRDHDNIEINMAADIVALYVMADDAPPCCSHYYCSAAGNVDRTEIYVVGQEDFPRWLKAEKAFPTEGVNLLEKHT